MSVTRDQVCHIAALARLELSDERAQALAADLNAILRHMDVLSTIETDGLDGVAGVGAAGTPLRADAGPPIPLARPLAEMAPAMRDGFFLVPRLATHEETESA